MYNGCSYSFHSSVPLISTLAGRLWLAQELAVSWEIIHQRIVFHRVSYKFIIGASLSEPHTSELALDFVQYVYIYISYVLIIVVFLCDDHLVTLHHMHAQYSRRACVGNMC